MTPNYTESAINFACEGDTLFGIVSAPLSNRGDGVGALIIVGGPQYRAGSHRQFTRLARQLADHGTPALRFDFRGMGDSTGATSTFLNAHEEIRAGIDALLASNTTLRSVVLVGLCDAVSAALMYLVKTSDPRIVGLVFQNPWLRAPHSESETLVKHYYMSRILTLDFWKKFLGGRVGIGAVGELARHLRNITTGRRNTDSIDFRLQMAVAWQRFHTPTLLQLAGRDLTAKEFAMQWDKSMPNWRNRAQLTLQEYSDADHTFSNLSSEQSALQAITSWWHQCFDPNFSDPNRL